MVVSKNLFLFTPMFGEMIRFDDCASFFQMDGEKTKKTTESNPWVAEVSVVVNGIIGFT